MKHTTVITFALVAFATLSSTAFAGGGGHHHPKCDVDALIGDYLAAFNSHDPGQLEAILADDYTVTSPYGEFDRDGWISLSAGAWYALPDIQWSEAQVLVDGKRFALEYTFTGTFVNDFPPYAATGNVVYGRGLEINEIDRRACEIVQTWNYSDAFGFFAQLQ
jgi:hypothetical protein